MVLGTVGSCDYGNELEASITRGEFLGELSDCQFLKKGCVPCGVSFVF